MEKTKKMTGKITKNLYSSSKAIIFAGLSVLLCVVMSFSCPLSMWITGDFSTVANSLNSSKSFSADFSENTSNALCSTKAYATEGTSTSVTPQEANTMLAAVKAEYNQILAQANSARENVQATTAKAFEVQENLLKKQQQLRDLMVFEYKNQSSSSFLEIFLTSKDVMDLVKTIDGINRVNQEQNKMIAREKEIRKQFDALLAELNAQNEKYNNLLTQAESKVEEAKALVDRVSSADASQLDQLRGLAISISGQINPGVSWQSGVASAYGGASDPSTPNPGTTATGARCDDWSMGVAIPMAWPNYRAYFNRPVQIRYGGQIVLAVVNDCGYMGAGARSLDLQPGVFKAFGAGTCQIWGLRTVEFCIL